MLATSVCSQEKRSEKPAPKEIKDQTNLTIRYIGNEGVLISAGGKRVLIDGLHREYKSDYAFPPKDVLDLLETARAPYDRIDLLLVSHIHLDHFHPESVGLHLKNDPQSLLVTSEQAAGEVAKNFSDYEKIKGQIRPFKHEWKKSFEVNENGIKVRLLALRHSGERARSIENLGHLIEIGGRKLLHIGDADMTDENFSAFALDKEKIDVAFIPYWYLISENGRRLIARQFAPKQIVAVHIPPAEAESITEQIKGFYPDAVSLTRISEEKTF